MKFFSFLVNLVDNDNINQAQLETNLPNINASELADTLIEQASLKGIKNIQVLVVEKEQEKK